MDAHNEPKTIGEALRVKGRNPIKLVCYKRKVTRQKKGTEWRRKNKGRKEKTGEERKTLKERNNGGKHLREENPW